MQPVALTIAGSDPSGGAGLQADLKTFHQFGVYGEAAVTLITVQNTRTVARVEVLPPDLVREQIEAILADIPPDAAKIGALGNKQIIEEIAAVAVRVTFPLVLDPVMISKHGSRLLSSDAEQTLIDKLLPHAFLITPNIPEAEALTGIHITGTKEMHEAAQRLLGLGCRNALIKGGHASGPADDLFVSHDGFLRLPGARIETPHTHGTGCTYSAAIAACLAQGLDLQAAARQAKSFIHSAIQTAPGLGHGHGPVNHFAELN
ncbi:MAG: bifunctional hydroxymethylpyrimidine kinase/phosphomethylpyrimidine kinase [Acidobacteriaceae bacterium]|nr:bifunctional hydroxymethylpyrimidine kinase/phosphomethylpyrimidine kinase [Acidobacteriaceae bacterium]